MYNVFDNLFDVYIALPFTAKKALLGFLFVLNNYIIV